MTYLSPTAAIYADAILTGDPKRAMDLATRVITKPLMSNLSRGLWGYSGSTQEGDGLTIQSTGIGGPSAAVVVRELADLGVERAIRVGTCTAVDATLEPGEVVVVGGAVARDGVGSKVAGSEPIQPDPALAGALATGGGKAGSVESVDLLPSSSRAAGSLAVDLSTAAVLAVGRASGLRCASALVVAESASGATLEAEELDSLLLDVGVRAAAALARTR